MTAGCRTNFHATASGPGERTRGSRLLRAVVVALAAMLGAAFLAASTASAAGTNGGSQWVTDVSGGEWGAGTMTFGSTPITAAISANTGTAITAGMGAPYCSGQESTNVALTGNAGGQIVGADQFYTPSAPSDAVGVCQGHPGSFWGGAATRTVTFNKPILAPVFIVNNLDASELTFNPGPGGGAIQLTELSSSPPLDVVGGNTLRNANLAGSAGCSSTPAVPTNNSGCGAFRMAENGGPVRSYTLVNTPRAAGADGWLWSMWFPAAPLTKQFSPNRIPVGGTSQLTFTIANPNSPGQPTLTPLDFTDVLPANVSLAEGSATNNGSCGSPSVTDAGGSGIGAGDTGVKATNISVAAGATCTITVNVTSSVVGNYVNDNNNLSTTIANLIPNASTPLEVYPIADVEIEKSTAATVVAGEEATYELKVTNHGPNTATNVKVSDPLPSALSFVSASSGCAQANGTVTCSIASLANGASQTFTVKANVSSSADSCADVRNTATVTNDVTDPDLTNNSSSVCDLERRSNLSMTKTASSGQVAHGGQVMYTLVVKNNGPSDAANVKVTDPMAAGLSLVSAKPSQGFCSTTGGKVSCNMGTLQAGGSAQVLVTATVTAPAGSCGTNAIKNTAKVTSDSNDPDPANNSDSAQVCVTPDPPPTAFDLVSAKTASSKSVYVGQPLTYTVTVTNKGPAAAPAAKVTDTLNHAASVVSVKASQGSCTKSIPMTCQLGSISAGGKVTITVKVKLRDSGCKQRNAASATGAGTDSNPANNMAAVDVCAKPVPLRLTKVADRASVRAGGTMGYTIHVSNPSAGEAKDAKVCDKLPSGLVYVSSKATAKFSNGQYCWTIKTLGAHESESFRITVRALGSASGDRVNRATASATGAKTARAKDPVRVLGARASGGGVTG
jgi:uncharacterized repeat protein (TIGR01451 family)